MKHTIFKTDNSWAPFIIRVLLGVVVFPHGAQKLLGLFGGYGFNGTMSFFTDTVGLPWLIGFIVILLEFLGAIVLILGITTRLMAIAYVLLAIGIAVTRIEFGFFMNWFNNQGGEGYEFFILWVGMAASLIITGGGRYSLDNLINLKLLKE